MTIRFAHLREQKMLKLGQHLLPLTERTLIMGILNITPDSFSDGGKYIVPADAVAHAEKMVMQGADIIDIGAESTRPGAETVAADVELHRIIPIIEKLAANVDVALSVDTYKAEVAEAALQAGAHMINDIWGLQYDDGMAAVVARYGVPVVIMHNQVGTHYPGDIICEVKRFLQKSIGIALNAGIAAKNIIVDPGLGFGKTVEHNIEIMSRLGEFNTLGYPILLGASRKSMIGKILDLSAPDRVEGTVATTVMGIMQGIDIVRVHDVLENARAAKVTDAIVRGNDNG